MCSLIIVFFFKQKTAYEMRISDWSSDVCSSDLGTPSPQPLSRFAGEGLEFRVPPPPFATLRPMEPLDTVYRWSDRMRDRARTGTFLRFLWRRFLDDRLFESAVALSFTMVFALVPLSLVVFGVLSA